MYSAATTFRYQNIWSHRASYVFKFLLNRLLSLIKYGLFGNFNNEDYLLSHNINF